LDFWIFALNKAYFKGFFECFFERYRAFSDIFEKITEK